MSTKAQNFTISKGCDPWGTSLRGYMDADYKDIVKAIGKPEAGSYKTDAEWCVTINGKVLTIYNYKDGKNYNGPKGTPTTKIRDWHIGGHGNVKEEAKFLAQQCNGTYRGD